MERYEEHDGCYVLYLDGMRAGASDAIALLIDACAGRLITHGDPGTVRCEFEALRRAQPPEATLGWLLLEGRPCVSALNRALQGTIDIHDLHLAFTRAGAQRIANELIARLLGSR